MHPSLHRAATRLRRRTLVAHALGSASRWLAVGLVLCGALALGLRAFELLEGPRLAWCFAPLLAVPAIALWRGRQGALSEAGAVCWLDRADGGRGEFVTEAEASNFAEDASRDSLRLSTNPEDVLLPRVRWRHALLRPVPSAVFCAAAFLVPMPQGPLLGPPTAIFEESAEELRTKLETLQEEVELDEERAEQLELALERVEEELEAGTPEAAFEALDRAQDQLERTARELEEEAFEARDRLANDVLSSEVTPESALEAFEEKLSELSDAGLMKDMGSELSELIPGKDLPSELFEFVPGVSLQLPKGLELSPEQLEALAKKLMEGLEGKLSELAKAGLLDAKHLGKLSDLKSLSDMKFAKHVCDENCEKPGGT